MSWRFGENCLFVLLVIIAAVQQSSASPALEFLVVDQHGHPLADAVIYLKPADGDTPPFPEVMDQVNLTFDPHVLPVRLGTPVDFPNSDQVRHHVYSFSPAKRFELPLYSGIPAEPVIFDRPGKVILGCNIHDRMLAYIYVVDTPYFARSDTRGRVSIEAVPSGDYRLHMWHPREKTEFAGESIRWPGEVSGLRLSINVDPPASDVTDDDGASSLQQRFRRFRSP